MAGGRANCFAWPPQSCICSMHFPSIATYDATPQAEYLYVASVRRTFRPLPHLLTRAWAEALYVASVRCTLTAPRWFHSWPRSSVFAFRVPSPTSALPIPTPRRQIFALIVDLLGFTHIAHQDFAFDNHSTNVTDQPFSAKYIGTKAPLVRYNVPNTAARIFGVGSVFWGKRKCR